MTALRLTTESRPPRAHRGQALIMAVLIMFLLVGLAGVFIAMINRTLVQTARAAERSTLEQVAQAGMQLAEAELRQGTLGADWRPDAGPDANNRGWQYDPNGGFYKITLTYGGITPYTAADPFLQNPLDRYLKVDVEARFTLDNPPNVTGPLQAIYQEGFEEGRLPNKKFLTRKITAYVPIALTDYLVWVTNIYESAEPATLGNSVELSSYGDPAGSLRTVAGNPALYDDETLNATAFATAINIRYLQIYDGPIRSEGDLRLGDTRIDLTRNDSNYKNNFTVLRQDMLQVRGQLSEYAASSATRRLLVNGHNTAMGVLDSKTNFEPVARRTDVLLVQYLQTESNTGSIPALRAPKLDGDGLERYRKLTRESGYYDAGLGVNIGHIGWGEGIYINNYAHIQYNGDIAALREEWLTPDDAAATATCWENGVYKPADHPSNARAMKLILHDWTYDNASNTARATKAPFIEIVTANPYNLKDYNSTTNVYSDLTINTATNLYSLKRPYPRNGVILAEGNVVVTGNLPAAVAYESNTVTGLAPIFGANGDQRPGGWNAGDGSISYYVTPANRRFDLTIVSAGTVYIEGSLLGPASRAEERPDDAFYLPFPGGHYLVNNSGRWLPEYIRRGDEYDTKVALLAADSVCLNPTRVIETVTTTDGSPLVSTSRAPDPVRFWEVTASATNTAIQFSLTTGGPITPDSRMRLLLRHSGDGQADQTATSVQMVVNRSPAQAFPFFWNPNAGASATNLYFCNSAGIDSLYSWLYTQNFVNQMAERKEWSDKQWGGDRFNLSFLTPPNQFFGRQSWNILDYQKYTGVVNMLPPLFGFGRRNTFLFTANDIPDNLDPHDGAPYLLYAGDNNWVTVGEKFGQGILATGLDVQVDALVYAQRGSWFIIPGRYWHDYHDPDNPNPPAGFVPERLPKPFPEFQEPYDVRITINGAITENTPAPAYMQQQWIERWRGANIWYFDTGGDGKSDLWDPGATAALWNSTDWRWNNNGDNRRMGIVYTYDATLARPVCYEVDSRDPSIRYYTPRLPRLPVGPELLFVQEAQET